MEQRRGLDWGRAASMIFCIAAGGAALYLILRYLLGILIPFLVAALVAAAVNPMADKIGGSSRIPRRLAAGVLVFIILALVILGCSLGVRRLLTELGELARQISDEGSALNDMIGSAIDYFDGIADNVAEKLPAVMRRSDAETQVTMRDRIDAIIGGMIDNAVSTLSQKLPGILSSIVSSLPGLLLAVAVTVIAAFYFALDRDRVSYALSMLLPASARGMLPHIKKEAAMTAVKYIRAYSLILFVTFSELFFGFSVIGVEYSLLLAVIISLIDILPVLGAGTVLIPWAVIKLITHDVRTGVGLLVIYAVVIIVRQLIEPKIVGESLGVHPLLTLFSMYVGFRLFGIIGMFAGPLFVVAVRAMRDIVSREGA